MEALDLISTDDLIAEVIKRCDAKEVGHLIVIGSDNQEEFIIWNGCDTEQVVDIYEILMEDLEGEDHEWGLND